MRRAARRARARWGIVAAALIAAGCTGGGGQPGAGGAGESSPAPTGHSGSASPTSAPRSFTVVATGDVLPHEELWGQARRDARGGNRYDFRPLFSAVRPVVRDADLAVCHMETPFAPRGGPYEGFPTFASPPQIADALAWLGYDACSTASNHTLDQGFSGVTRTLDTLDRTGITAYGSSRNAKQVRRPDIVEVSGVRVGLLSYTFSFNGIPEPEDKSWIADRIDPERILADARRAKRAGAQVVLASLHWGGEYQHEITEQQRELAPRLLSSPDIDLLIGHHAHVAQPMERIEGEWVAYGLGNHVAAHDTPVPANHEGVLARFTFIKRDDGWTAAKAEYLPTYVTGQRPLRLLNVPEALAGQVPASVSRSRLEKARDRTARVVESRGGADDGLSMIRPGS